MCATGLHPACGPSTTHPPGKDPVMSDFYEEDEPVADVHARFDAATERGVTARPDDGPDHPFVPAAEDTTRCAYAKSRSDASTFCWRPADEHSRTHLTEEEIQALADEAERGYDPDLLTARQPATTAVDAVPGTVWKGFTYDAGGGYIEELAAPDGHLCVALTTLNERPPARRVHYVVARKTTRPQR